MRKASRSIETVYNGVKFKSRTEARWAYLFDRLSVPWTYEPEGYELPSGEKYLPDFKIEVVRKAYDHILEKCTCFVEIKPDRASPVVWKNSLLETDYPKTAEFAKNSDLDVILIEGPPKHKTDCFPYFSANTWGQTKFKPKLMGFWQPIFGYHMQYFDVTPITNFEDPGIFDAAKKRDFLASDGDRPDHVAQNYTEAKIALWLVQTSKAEKAAAEKRIEAFTWANLAALNGHSDTQFRLGKRYLDANRMDMDKQGVTWIEAAAHQGHSDAQLFLANWYKENVRYVSPSRRAEEMEKANFWAETAADNGEAEAFFLLGEFAYNGTGRPEDKDFAYISYRKSLELGYKEAWFALSAGWGIDEEPPEGLVS